MSKFTSKNYKILHFEYLVSSINFENTMTKNKLCFRSASQKTKHIVEFINIYKREMSKMIFKNSIGS